MPAPYFSELKFLGNASVDFIEVAVDAGSSVANISVVVYHSNGSVRSTNALGVVDGTVAGRDVYTIDTATSATFTGLNKNGAVALVVNGTVTSFLSFQSSVTATAGPANGMTSTQLGATGAGESFETTDNGATYQIQSTPTPDTVPCYVAGTRILTPRGYRPVEDLRAGDLVWTEDDGYCAILWAGSRAVDAADAHDPAVAPIRIPAGAFGPGAPLRDLYISPNHRIALSHTLCALYFESYEVLAPAKALLGHRGIAQPPNAAPVHYHHLLLERHHILRAEGLAAESFLPEAMALNALKPSDRTAVAALTQGADYGPTARITLKPDELRVVLAGAGADVLDLYAPEQAALAA